jgi:hypothetical protein
MYQTKSSCHFPEPHHAISTKGCRRVVLPINPTARHKIFRLDIRIFPISWDSLENHEP